MAAMQGFRGAVERWGGRGGRGGASWGVGEARGGRWPWVRRRWWRAPLGGVREREAEERGGGRSRERGRSERGSGRRVASSGASLGRPGRKQEVAEQGGGGARGGVAVSVLLARRKTTGEGGGGGLGQREELGRLGWTGRRQVGSVLFIFFYFL